jgi:hypothetical protein
MPGRMKLMMLADVPPIRPNMTDIPGIRSATIRAEPERKRVKRKCSSVELSVEGISSSTYGNPSRDR